MHSKELKLHNLLSVFGIKQEITPMAMAHVGREWEILSEHVREGVVIPLPLVCVSEHIPKMSLL